MVEDTRIVTEKHKRWYNGNKIRINVAFIFIWSSPTLFFSTFTLFLKTYMLLFHFFSYLRFFFTLTKRSWEPTPTCWVLTPTSEGGPSHSLTYFFIKQLLMKYHTVFLKKKNKTNSNGLLLSCYSSKALQEGHSGLCHSLTISYRIRHWPRRDLMSLSKHNSITVITKNYIKVFFN